jgi:hypothetical protein
MHMLHTVESTGTSEYNQCWGKGRSVGGKEGRGSQLSSVPDKQTARLLSLYVAAVVLKCGKTCWHTPSCVLLC